MRATLFPRKKWEEAALHLHAEDISRFDSVGDATLSALFCDDFDVRIFDYRCVNVIHMCRCRVVDASIKIADANSVAELGH
jgi:hypothetical protein